MAVSPNTPPGLRRGGIVIGCPPARPSRRELLSAAGFTTLAGIAAVAIAKPDAQAVEVLPTTHGADAALIALCDRFTSLEQAIDASYEAGAGRGQTMAEEDAVEQAERDPLRRQQAKLLPQIVDARATTLDGFRARARAIMTYDKEGLKRQEINSGPVPGGMAWALVRDLVGEEG